MKNKNKTTWTVSIPEHKRGKKAFVGAGIPAHYRDFMDEVGKGELGFQSKSAIINHLLREWIRKYEETEKRKK